MANSARKARWVGDPIYAVQKTTMPSPVVLKIGEQTFGRIEGPMHWQSPRKLLICGSPPSSESNPARISSRTECSVDSVSASRKFSSSVQAVEMLV